MDISQIIKQIKSELDVPMSKWVEAQCLKIQGLREYKKSDVYLNVRSEDLGKYKILKSENQFYHLQSLGYTKADMNNLGYSAEVLKSRYEKDAQHKLLRVDVAVNKKLKNIEVSKIARKGFSHGLDGFIEGSWVITDSSNEQYIFKFETHLAGGYNIQCLHIRTKYQLNKIK